MSKPEITDGPEQAATQQATEKALAFDEVKLSDGRIVKMREQIGNDEMIVAGQIGNVFESNGSGYIIFQTCLIVRTIVSVDGIQPEKMRNYESVRDFLAGFKAKDFNRLKKLFDKLNGEEGNE